MKKITVINIAILLFASCANNTNYKSKAPCVIDFWYDKNEAIVAKGMVSVILTEDREFRNMLLTPQLPTHLKFEYHGGIYNIDTLYFPPPIENIIRINDSIILLGQNLSLEQYLEAFMDSIVEQTKRELVIEITNTISGKKWVIPSCVDKGGFK